MNCLCRSLLGVSVLIFMGGCTALNENQSLISKKAQINDDRLSIDRTLVLSDISPVVDAYVKHPYPLCNKSDLQEAAKKGELSADLSKPFSERVYRVSKVKMCIGF